MKFLLITNLVSSVEAITKPPYWPRVGIIDFVIKEVGQRAGVGQKVVCPNVSG
jgi:hypothetical protein